MRLTWALLLPAIVAAPVSAEETRTPSLQFRAGAVNHVVISRHESRLAVYAVPANDAARIDMVLLTHVRRDVLGDLSASATGGSQVVAPASEAQLCAKPKEFWTEWRNKRFHDYAQQSSRVPVRDVPIARPVKEGDLISWQDLTIRVLDTPGYTRGAVSYLTEVDGQKIAFTGDLIRDDGKLQDLFSLQDAIPAAKIGGYHGWAGRLGDLVTSLQKIAAQKPDVLVPVRGPVIERPQEAIDRMLARIRAVYANYLSIDALRWYFKDEHILTKARRVLGPDARVDWMPMAETQPLRSDIRAISNSRLILSTSGRGFLVDCGGTGIVDKLKELRAGGELESLDHVFVTHYHDDHTDALPLLVQEFGAKVHACGSLIDVLEHPGDYRLPCLTKNPIAVTSPHPDRESFAWEEYRLTIYDFPGQTLHHNGLLVEKPGGDGIFFAGDSFTPSGIDDYCLQNRNFLAEGHGFLRCLDLVQGLPPGCWLINQHVEPAFRFSSAQISRMQDTLRRRVPLLQELLPFDDSNFGLDEGWAVLHPYSVRLRPTATAHLQLRITNHSPQEQLFHATVEGDNALRVSVGDPVRLASRTQGHIEVHVTAPADARPGLHVVTVGVAWPGGDLRNWSEALVEVEP